MKNTLSLVVAVAAILAIGSMLSGCKGEPGPQGPPASVPTSSRLRRGIQCASCHNPTPTRPITSPAGLPVGAVEARDRRRHRAQRPVVRRVPHDRGLHPADERADGDVAVPPEPTGMLRLPLAHSRADFTLRKDDPVTILSNISACRTRTSTTARATSARSATRRGR